MPRIVSLIASATEIVCALGLEDHLVGRSHECDFPESIRRLPVCTAPKFDVNGSSNDIDRRVKALVRDGLSVYHVDAEKLKSLRPEVLITQTQCEVCAVSLRDVEQAVCALLDCQPRIVSLAPNNLADVWTDIQGVADGLEVSARGSHLIRRLQERMHTIADKASGLPHRPTVAGIEWIDPLMAIGNWMPEMVAMAGGYNLFGLAGRHSPWLTWKQVREQDPEVLLVLPCGFDLARTRLEMPALTEKPDWPDLRAVRNGRVYLMDGNQYFNRPGPRLVESLEILAEVIHPETFHFGHETESEGKDRGWQRL